MLIFIENIGKAIQYFIGLKKKVVKIHRTAFKTAVAILCIDADRLGPACIKIFTQQVGVFFILLGKYQGILAGTDAILHLISFIDLIIEVALLDNGFDKGAGIL